MAGKPRRTIAGLLLALLVSAATVLGAPTGAYAADTYIDLKEVFGEWINFPGANLGSGYAAGWQYRESDGSLMTTQNVGFTGYYNPNLMSFTTGTFACDFQSNDTDPWGFAWGIQKKQNSAGQDVYSFYMYEECGCGHWCIAHVSEWVPAKDGSPHRGPVYHSTIDAADGQYAAHNGGKGSVGYTQGSVLAYGTASVKNVRHRVTMNVTKNKITVTSPSVGIDASVDAPVQPGSFGPVTASNSSAFYYNLSMEAAEDNGAIKADFQLFDNGEPSYAGVPSDTLSMEDRTWLDPATKATIRNETWTVFDPAGRQVYQGSNPYSGVVDQEGEYRVVLEVLTSQGLTAKKTKYFTVSNASIVTVNYVTESGEKLTDTITYKGRAGKPYQTIDLSFNGYVLAGVEGEESGVFLEGRPISVTYSYKKLDDEGPEEGGDTAQPVTARYVDADSGEDLCDPMVYRGAVGDPYTVTRLDFPGYVFVRVEERTDSVTTRGAGPLAAALSPERDADDPTTKTGNFGFQARTITYYYRKDAAAEQGQGTILLRFVDENDVTLVEDLKLTGTVGDPATAALPKITKYDIKTVGGRDAAGSYTYAGTFGAGVTVVKVVYSPITYTASSVMVLYRDPDGNTIKSQVIDGNAGDSYTTSALDIPGYELVALPDNASGTFAADSVTLVVYQYRSTLNKETEDGGKINIDTDDDGLPDVNVDTDGDGVPDVNIDTDGDGVPDKNLVVDDEGKPKPIDPEEPEIPSVNIDVDGDGEPDINIDTDGDGIPDVNIVPDEDGKPRPVDPGKVDPSNPPKPQVNFDTDGDGKPDINIDTDGDGVPDTNVDVDDNGVPDINVDTDDDGVPDVNIVDKDGDGRPDPVAPGTDPDTVTPDVNVVVDDKGDPVINIDPKDPDTPYPPRPQINVDTDGDGRPDVNIDKDGDGVPDVNVDTDGDGEPDTNIDTTGDGKPDTNIDTNNDGKPDVNVDTTGDGRPDTNVDTDGDGIPDENVVDEPVVTYTVTTRLRGITAGASISPSANVAKGGSATVSWAPGENTYVSRVEVDGRRVDAKGGSYGFSHLSGDHSVVVTLAEIPLIPAQTTKGYYTITVNTYGVSKGVEASDSMAVAAGSSEAVTWSAKEGHVIKSVSVDGVRLGLDQVAAGAYDFAAISANHVVDIVVEAEDGTTGLAPDSVVVSTKIEGGPGTITGGSTVARGDDYTVAWNPVIQTTADRNDPSYAVYEVESVSVNGTVMDGTSANDVSLTNIKENQEVVVRLRPVTFNVAILKYGDGTAKPSKTVYKGNHYVDISAQANAGSRITYLEVDGKEVYREGAGRSVPLRQQLKALPAVAAAVPAADRATASPTDDARPDAESPQTLAAAIADAGAGAGEGAGSDAPVVQELSVPQDQPAEEGDEGMRTDGAEGEAAEDGEPEETSLLDGLLSATVTKAYAAEVPAAAFNPEEVVEPVLTGTARMDMGIRDIDKDHQVKVYFAKDGEPAVTPETLGSTVDIETQVDGGPGEIAGGGIFDPAAVDPDDPPRIQWEVPEGYTPTEVIITPKDGSGDPVVVPVAPGQTGVDIPQSILGGGGEYVVRLKVQKEDEGDDVAPKQRETLSDKAFYEVASSITGGPGTITATTDAMEGAGHTVTWAAGEGYRVAKVLVDGEERPDLAEATSYSFEDLASDHRVEVVLEPVVDDEPDPDPDEKPSTDKPGQGERPGQGEAPAERPAADLPATGSKAVRPVSGRSILPATGDVAGLAGAFGAAAAAVTALAARLRRRM